jgi:hypothetical protein
LHEGLAGWNCRKGNFFIFLSLVHYPNPFKTDPPMNKPIYNDQNYIAERFMAIEESTIQTARLAYFKINSYKLSMMKASFSKSREELTDNLRCTLFNYTDSSGLLTHLGFFDDMMEN